MRVSPSGVVFVGECEVQTAACQALTPAPLSAVWASPGRRQINVCRACLEEMIRGGQWEIEGSRLQPRADLALLDGRQRAILVVEVESRPMGQQPAAAWAQAVYRNLRRHRGIPAAEFLLLVRVPDLGFLWRVREACEDAAPDYQVDLSTTLGPYLVR